MFADDNVARMVVQIGHVTMGHEFRIKRMKNGEEINNREGDDGESRMWLIGLVIIRRFFLFLYIFDRVLLKQLLEEKIRSNK